VDEGSGNDSAAEEVWVIPSFHTKSTRVIKTPQREIDLVKDRLQNLKEKLRSKCWLGINH
jgi:phage-related protein